MISEQLENALKNIGKIILFPKNEYLFHEGSEANSLFVVQNGSVKISKVTQEGQEFCFQIAKSGDMIGEVVLFTSTSAYLANAKALTKSEVLVIAKNDLENLFLNNTELSSEYIRWSGENIQKIQTKTMDLIMFGKKGAVFSTLVRMTNTYGKVTSDGILIDTPLTNQALSEFCGTTRENINRILSELKSEGVVSINHQKITIHNIDYLKKFLCCDDCPFHVCQI